MSIDPEEMDLLKKILRKLPPEQRQSLIDEPDVPLIPTFVWNSNMIGFKATLKYLEEKGGTTISELKQVLRSQGFVKDSSDSDNYGIVYEETGIFHVNGSKVTLTSTGKELASLFNDDFTDLTPIEKMICRGLQQQGAGYSFLHIIGQNPGILREDLMKQLEGLFGGKGRYYAGYYVTIFSKLDLIRKGRDGRRVRYYSSVPESWATKIPDIQEE